MFRRTPKHQKPTTRTEYPAGTFIKTEKGYFYVVNKTKRYRITSLRVLASWSPQRVAESTEAAVAHLRVASKMKFRNGSLIHSLSDGRIYLIEEGLRRHVTSPDALTRIGAVQSEAVTVSRDEINLHQPGEDLY